MTLRIPRTAIVAGQTGELGLAASSRLLSCGWRLVVPWSDEAERDRLSPHENLVLIRADLTSAADIESVVDLASKDADIPLYGVVNLVGGMATGERINATPIEVLDAQLSINLHLAYGLIQAVLPRLIRSGGGSVVCVGSVAPARPFPGAASHIASKAAIGALVQALAVEYAEDNIRVNGLLPMLMDKDLGREAAPGADAPGSSRPSDIATVIAFLLGDSSRAVTGAAIPVLNVAGFAADGGFPSASEHHQADFVPSELTMENK